jgi:hypothetical protein
MSSTVDKNLLKTPRFEQKYTFPLQQAGEKQYVVYFSDASSNYTV